ncbi:sodium:solute symporter family protein [Lentisphaerota bacterium WC36G]|nr:sodium:solute symporter family protein [Lentisphaerae bacterium WC36]
MEVDIVKFCLVIAIFAILIGGLGYLGYKKTKSSADFLVGGREIHPFVMAMSYGAAFISTSAIVGFGGVAGRFGLGLLWLPLCNIVIGIFIAFVFFGKRTRRMGLNIKAHSFPEFIGNRFQSDRIKVICGAIIFSTMPLYAAVVLIGGAKFIGNIVSLNFKIAIVCFAVFIALYVIIGGLKAVMYIDALMGTIMISGMLFLLVMTYYKIGGVVEGHQALTDMAHLVPEKLKAVGHQGWTKMPAFGSTWWWVLVSTLILGVGIGTLAQPQLSVRFMTVKSNRELNRAVLVGAIFIMCTAGIAYVVGSLSNVYFFQTIGKTAMQAANGDVDSVIPQFISVAMPDWFVYIFTVTLLSAGMSTLSALFHAMGASVGYDCYTNLMKKNKQSIIATKTGIVVGIILSTILALSLPEDGIVARGTAIFFGICAGTFLPSYTAAVFWKRATKQGVYASIFAGLAVSTFCLTFLHGKEAKILGICKLLFGKDVLITAQPWPVIDPIIFSLPLSILVLVIVSLLSKKPSSEHINLCFEGIDKNIIDHDQQYNDAVNEVVDVERGD